MMQRYAKKKKQLNIQMLIRIIPIITSTSPTELPGLVVME
jgi:hypothetical protein